jgi:hypothetical protein
VLSPQILEAITSGSSEQGLLLAFLLASLTVAFAIRAWKFIVSILHALKQCYNAQICIAVLRDGLIGDAWSCLVALTKVIYLRQPQLQLLQRMMHAPSRPK